MCEGVVEKGPCETGREFRGFPEIPEIAGFRDEIVARGLELCESDPESEPGRDVNPLRSNGEAQRVCVGDGVEDRE